MSSQILEQPIATRRPALVWPAAMLPFSALILWAINTGGEALRWLMLGGVTSALALPLLVSLEAGLLAMILFEPFRGFLRRAQYILLPYTQSDPIHVITPVVTFLAFVMLFQRRKLALFHATPVAKLVSVLGFIYFLQIFNPLQGGLAIGFSGALFSLVPVAWFYFGQEVKTKFINTVFRFVIVLGLVSSLYGLYHLTYGFPAFEQYWLDHTDAYESIALGQIKRALATYSSAEEWARYIEVGALAAFGYGAGAVGLARRGGWFLCGLTLTVMVMLTGQRTALFGLLLGAIILFVLGAKTTTAKAGRLLLAFAPLLLVTMIAKAPQGDDVWSLNEDERFEAALSHTARGALHPTKEDSLQERVDIWTMFATEIVPKNPLGLGLGATSLAAHRSEGREALPPVDSYFISSVITCGLPAALLFMFILGKTTWMSWKRFRELPWGSAESKTWRILASVMPALMLNSFFGNTFTLYSVAPLGWLFVGWISRERTKSIEREIIEI